MSAESVYLVVLLAAALVVFYRGTIRIDLAALLILLALLVPWRPVEGGGLASVLTLQQALSGFGSPAVAMIAAMFVLAAAMEQTGAATLIGSKALAVGSRSELLFQLTILTVITAFSGVISDTTTVLVWMPLIMAVCRERGYAPSRVLLPLAFASLLGGQWTLIGTRSNVIASDYLRSQTGAGLGFLDFTPVALCIWGASLVFFVAFGRRLLPRLGAEPSLADRYAVKEYLTEIMASPASGMVGRTLQEVGFDDTYGVTLLSVVRDDVALAPSPALILRPNDVLIVQGRISSIAAVVREPGMQVKEELQLGDKTLRSVDLRMVEATIAPRSQLAGHRLEDTDFCRKYGVSVLAIGHHGRAFSDRPLSRRLESGDSLLLVGHEEVFDRMRDDPAVLLLQSRPLPVVSRSKPLVILALMALVVLTVATGVFQAAFAMILSAVLAVLLGCISLRDAYRSIDLRIVMVLGGVIPLGLALEVTHTAELFAESLTRFTVQMGPGVVFAALLAVTVLLTQIIENAAAAAILAPIAYRLALSVGADPAPFLLGMAICTSAGFATPWAHESTLLVFGPGRYETKHYLALGLPFTVIAWGVTVVALPIFYPLTP